MYALSGGCHCGNIRVELSLARPPDSYHPRACDCDFCRKHGAAYVSDPHGSLAVHIGDETHAGRYRQGSGQAELLLCRRCGVLVGALYRADTRVYAAVNARVIEPAARFGAEQPVSPQTLEPRDKARRWQEIWFPSVRVTSGAGAAA
jgi:hypothetical protein